jgi:phosphatidate cytidylyltransferase
MLKLRIITALVLIPLVVGAIFCLSKPYFMGVTAVFILLAAWEWSRLSSWTDLSKRLLYIGFQCIILLFLMKIPIRQWMLEFGLIFWLLLAIYLLWARTRLALPTIPVYIRAGLGWLILTFCWMALQVLHLTPFYLLFMLLVIWLVDTAAYASGRLWGQHLLAPMLSPKKTWEGLIIGLLVTFLVAAVMQYYFRGAKPFLWQIFILVLFTSFAAVAGDLFESQLKRLEGLKDSGYLLPGHGGLLDRIDSLLAAAPVFVGSLLLLGLVT